MDTDQAAVTLPIKLFGTEGRAFIDSGCSFNAISSKFAASSGIRIIDGNVDINCIIGGGNIIKLRKREATGVFNLFHLGEITVDVLVMDPIPGDCDAIFGMQFLKHVNPDIDWITGTLAPKDLATQDKPSNDSVLEEINHLTQVFHYNQVYYMKQGQETRVISKEELEDDVEQIGPGDCSTFSFLIRTCEPELTKSQRFNEQSWDALRDNPAFEVLLKYRDSVFKEKLTANELPVNPAIEHTIELVDSKPITVKQFRLSPDQQQAVEAWTKDMLQAGLIRPSTSPYSSPIFCVKKPVGWRIVHDYRLLNSITRIPQQPIPRKEEILDAMYGGYWFSCMDLLSGYYQLLLRERDREFTAFSTPLGHFEYLVTAQGLAGAPATFNRFIQEVFRDLQQYSRAFFDDIYIFTKDTDIDNHLIALDQVLQRCKDRGLSIKLAKCVFVNAEIPVLGDFVGRNGVRIDPEKVTIIRNWPVPKTRTQLKSFLGVVGYCARFCKNFGRLVAPLHSATMGVKKHERIVLGDDAMLAFNQLKQQMCEATILHLPDFSRPFGLRMDASDFAIGGLLFQLDRNQQECPIAFTGRKLTSAELSYPVREKELLAVMHALKVWRAYLLDKPFIVETDHQSLQGLLSQKTCSQRLARWLNLLSEYRPEFRWIPGPTNIIADSISRREDFEPIGGPASSVDLRSLLKSILDQPLHVSPVPVIESANAAHLWLIAKAYTMVPSTDQARLEFIDYDHALMMYTMIASPNVSVLCQNNYPLDPYFSPLWILFRKGGRDSVYDKETTDMVTIRKLARNFTFKNNLLWYNGNNGLRLCVPECKELKLHLLFTEHDEPTKGHPGIFKTVNFIKRKYYWRGMDKEIKDYVMSCEKCQRNKFRQSRAPGLLQSLPVPEARWQHILWTSSLPYR